MTLHQGAKESLQRLGMDELDIARAMSAGELSSHQRYENILLVAMRITGTGTSFRKALDEYVYRRPENYLNERFVARCNGLPVIVEHPESNTLNSQEFADRVVGTVFLPYIKGDEVWGIVKVFDDTAIEMLENHQLSTSPAVVFRDPHVNEVRELEDGATLLIEGKPSLLDHLAICEAGVWDKGGAPTGVDSNLTNGDSTMTDEEKKAAEMRDDAARKDAYDKEQMAKADAEAGEKLDKMLTALDSMTKRLDSLEKKRMDASEAEIEEEAKEEDPEQTVADKARRDAEDDEKKEAEMKAAEAKSDADKVRKRIDELEAKLPKELSDADYKEMAEEQADADKVHAAFGDAAPRPLSGETPIGYSRRLLDQLKRHSETWKHVPLEALPLSALKVAKAQIYADSMAVALNPTTVPDGGLRQIVNTDTTGRRITSFVGKPSSWMADFGGSRRRGQLKHPNGRAA